MQTPGEYGLAVEDDKHNGAPTGYGPESSYTIMRDIGKVSTKQYAMTITDAIGSNTFAGFDLNMAGTAGKLTVTNGESQTNVTQVQIVFTDSTAVSTSTTTTSGATISDEDNIYQSLQGSDCPDCHNPLVTRPKVSVYLDRQFGTLMFQDPAAPCTFGIVGTQRIGIGAQIESATTGTSSGAGHLITNIAGAGTATGIQQVGVLPKP